MLFNPTAIHAAGALIHGSESYYPFEAADEYSQERPSKSTRTTVHETIQLVTAAMALKHTETSVRSCELLHGVYQKYAFDGQL